MLIPKKSTIVIAVTGHNPTILSEDFLKKLEVVPQDWTTEQVLVTPPISLIQFDNGYSVKMELNRLSIEVSANDSIESTFIASSATRLVHAFPHNQFRATGINFNVEVEGHEVIQTLRAKFNNGENQPGLQNLQPNKIHWSGQIENVTLGIVMEISESKDSAIAMFNANYHRESESVESVLDSIGHYESDLADYSERIGEILR